MMDAKELRIADLEAALDRIILDRETYINNTRSLFNAIDDAKKVLHSNTANDNVQNECCKTCNGRKTIFVKDPYSACDPGEFIKCPTCQKECDHIPDSGKMVELEQRIESLTKERDALESAAGELSIRAEVAEDKAEKLERWLEQIVRKSQIVVDDSCPDNPIYYFVPENERTRQYDSLEALLEAEAK